MLARLSVFLCVLWSISAKTQFEEENDVAVLTKDNFDDAIKDYEFTMVEFYAPWCGHCKALKPEYEKIAGVLKNDLPSVLIAKVDATVESTLATQFEVKGYPTIKFHKNGAWLDYSGERSADAIISWIKRKLSPSITVLTSVSEVENVIQENEIAVVAFMKTEDADKRRVIEEVADTMDKHTFILVSSQDVLDKYGVSGDFQVSLFKKFDEGRADYSGEITAAAVTTFIQQESIELVVEFSQESAGKVFGSPIRMHLVAFAPKSGDFDKIKGQLLPVSKAFKGKAHFLIIDTDFEDHLRILDFFGMSKDDVPTYRLINLSEDMTKYKPDNDDFSETAMSSFINDVLSGNKKPFLMSQEIPPESGDAVRVLVGKTYNEVTQDESKAVFVELYAPWCGHCKQLAPIWEELAELYKDNPDIIISKMDATVNEAEGVKVHGFPTLKYYAKGSKSPTEYSGERTLEALRKFVDSEGKEEEAKKPDAAEAKDEL